MTFKLRFVSKNKLIEFLPKLCQSTAQSFIPFIFCLDYILERVYLYKEQNISMSKGKGLGK